MTQCTQKLDEGAKDRIISVVEEVRGDLAPSAWAKQIGISTNVVLCALQERQTEALFILVHHLARNGHSPRKVLGLEPWILNERHARQVARRMKEVFKDGGLSFAERKAGVTVGMIDTALETGSYNSEEMEKFAEFLREQRQVRKDWLRTGRGAQRFIPPKPAAFVDESAAYG